MLALLAALALCVTSFPKAELAGRFSRFPGASGSPGVFETQSSHPSQAGSISLGASGRLLHDLSSFQARSAQDGTEELRMDDGFAASSRIFAAAGLGAGFDLSLFIPVYYEFLPHAPSTLVETWGLGDFSAILKAKLPWPSSFLSFSIMAMGTAPTASDGGALPKRMAYQPYRNRFPDALSLPFGLKEPSFGAGLGTTMDLSDAMSGPQVALHLNLLADRTLGDSRRNPMGTFTASLAAEAYLVSWLRMEAEIRQVRLATEPARLGSPHGESTTLGAGLGTALPFGFSARFGAIIAPGSWNPLLPLTLETDDGNRYAFSHRFHPPLTASLQVVWSGFPFGRDRDKDAVPDGRDRCPSIPEDDDGFLDGDGCPENDNDGDGSTDASDGCPYSAEDHDGFEDEDGCPEMDNDRDGLLDTAEKCPNDPEDRDAVSDEDGCPDLDDDRDGIPDAVDKCTMTPENRNGIDDEDGCPDLDSDGDGNPDSRDKCPNEDEIINFFQDEDGCPDEKPEPVRDAVLIGIEFTSEGSELLPASFLVLDGLAARMFAYPGTEIEIQGHLDDRYGSKAKELSLQRAQTVAEYLFNRGIEARRVKTVGFGGSKPMATNRTAKGRESNRRIQIRRLN